jgi:hypothetical protein
MLAHGPRSIVWSTIAIELKIHRQRKYPRGQYSKYLCEYTAADRDLLSQIILELKENSPDFERIDKLVSACEHADARVFPSMKDAQAFIKKHLQIFKGTIYNDVYFEYEFDKATLILLSVE